VEDTPESWPVAATEPLLKHWLLTVRSDKIQMPDQNFAERTVVSHPGAVAVLALDDAGRVLMIRQYRHPVGYLLWEIPAGLRDAAGEPPLETARRELFEETGYRAREWHVLIDYFTSPGYSTERLRIYLARGVQLAAAADADAGYVRHDEEKYLVQKWVPLAEAVRLAFAGRLHNSAAITGVLAAQSARSTNFATLRPATAPEP
jgi:ADP-ribose pyrophosphatase